MKSLVCTLTFILFTIAGYTQVEIISGYAVNQNLADGLPIHIGYDLKIKKRLFTKSQIGYKYLYHYNDFVGATIKVSIWEFHQTISYEVIKKKKYIFKPNLGINYRNYSWKVQMKPPLNSVPVRALVIGIRDDKTIVVASRSGESHDEYKVGVPGFTIQLQNQFRLNDKLWLQLTPFLEPDYDRSQNTGGCYVGVIFKNL